MKITVITVCLNAQDLIERTLKSVCEQSYKDIEFIIFDGMSNDGTKEIIEKYIEHIDFFRREKDAGVYNAMNAAVKKASGEYVVFLNAGDVFVDKYVLENVAKRIKALNCPSIAYGQTIYMDTNGNKTGFESCSDVDKKYYFAYHNICHQSVFYKKEMFENDKYDETFKIYADWDFNVRNIIKKNLPAAFLDMPVSIFYEGGISTNKKNSNLFKQERKRIQKKYFKKAYPFISIDMYLTKTFKSVYVPLKNFFVGFVFPNS